MNATPRLPAIEVDALAVSATCTDDTLRVALADGREITVPLVWFPRLYAASAKQRQEWRLIGGGVGIHWPLMDEDISTESLLRVK